ncbi:MAG TPA: PKD domain-containing protein [Blastocatellia bacterium]|nr:PKD domain-containing protein [Blastocatellia bacterium]
MKRPIAIIILLSLCQLSCVSYAQKNKSAANANKISPSAQTSNPPGRAANSNIPIRDEIDPEIGPPEATSDELEKAIPEELRKQIACTIEETVAVTPDGGGPAPLRVTFDASESTSPCGKIVKWIWTFGDGSKGSGARVTHIYTKPGSYVATLEMRDSKGNRNDVEIDYAVAAN